MTPRSESAINALILFAQYTDQLSYYDDWRDAFASHLGIRAAEINICDADAGERLRHGLAAAELVVLLHSTNADTIAYLEPLVPLLAARRCLLLSFVGNEVNLPGIPISAKRDLFRRIEPDFIATQLLAEAGDYLFGDLARRGVKAVPHALNPDVFRPQRPDPERRIDIGVRSHHYLPHLGDNDRNRLFDAVRRRAKAHRLVVDISSDRVNRSGWAEYLNDCHGTVATEAGSWYISRDDEWVEDIRRYVAARSGGLFIPAGTLGFARLRRHLPSGAKSWISRQLGRFGLRFESTAAEAVPFDEIHARFFADRPRSPVYGKCISSRHFDAIGAGTCQILMAGRYNDILIPGEHYLAVSEDLSDLDQAMHQMADPELRRRIASAARQYVLEGHTYKNRIDDVCRFCAEGA